MRKTKFSLSVLFLAFILFGLPAIGSSLSIDVTVDSKAQPWLTSLNTSFDYGANDGTSPVQIGADDGFDFNVGDTLTVSYVSGSVCALGTSWCGDADGYTGYVANNNAGSSGNYFPSRYMSSASYPINLIALVGTFADNTGVIVGDPFEIGNGPINFIIPTGASYLQLGINDDIFDDNTGAFMVNISGPPTGSSPVPEPATMLLLGSGLIGLVGFRRKYRE